jgi:N-methylhydantoinase A
LRRGHDPRDFTFVAYGGAGPLHAAVLARELGVARTVIPPAPGHFSAFGMLLGDFRADAVRTHVGALDPRSLRDVFDALETEASAELEAEGGERTVERFARLRYVGQEHAVEVPLAAGPLDDELLARLRSDFDAASEETYAFHLPDAPVEIVEARVSVSAQREHAVEWITDAGPGRSLRPRDVDYDRYGGVQRAEVVERRSLGSGDAVPGPCIVEEPATTVLVLPDQTVHADDLGNLIIEDR